MAVYWIIVGTAIVYLARFLYTRLNPRWFLDEFRNIIFKMACRYGWVNLVEQMVMATKTSGNKRDQLVLYGNY